MIEKKEAPELQSGFEQLAICFRRLSQSRVYGYGGVPQALAISEIRACYAIASPWPDEGDFVDIMQTVDYAVRSEIAAQQNSKGGRNE